MSGMSHSAISGRLTRWPAQGEYVRMVEAPAEWMAPFVGWRFQITRHTRYGWMIVLRADYQHTPGPGFLELRIDELWFRRKFDDPPLTDYFEAVV